MRPKKRILLIAIDENEIGPLRLVLVTHAYHVLYVEDLRRALLEATAGIVDLVLILQPTPKETEAILAELKKIMPHVPMIAFGDPAKPIWQLRSAEAVVANNIAPFELLERIKVMSARKRGTRKGVTRAILPAPEVATA
jgi:two-component system, OmpR family, response regulator CpxR